MGWCAVCAAGDVVDMNLDGCVSRLAGRVTPWVCVEMGRRKAGPWMQAGNPRDRWRTTKSAREHTASWLLCDAMRGEALGAPQLRATSCLLPEFRPCPASSALASPPKAEPAVGYR